MTTYRPTRRGMTTAAPRRRLLTVAMVILAVVAAVLVIGYESSSSSPAASSSTTSVSPSGLPHDGRRFELGAGTPAAVWPAYGQAAVVLSGQSRIQAGPRQHPAPIASVAKVMTAYVVLSDHPLQVGQQGPVITITDDDVADTDDRRGHEESVVPVAAGEQLTELQALQALLLPSANNIAAVLARWDAGSAASFVVRMNAVARSLGMADTRYTDPSGFDADTVSTAADQVRLVLRAMRLPVFAGVVALRAATLPVAGTVHNTDRLLGHHGFVGVKTGSTSAAGGCFAFRAVRWVDGRRITVTGVVLGQPGRDQIGAGLDAAEGLVERIVRSRG